MYMESWKPSMDAPVTMARRPYTPETLLMTWRYVIISAPVRRDIFWRNVCAHRQYDLLVWLVLCPAGSAWTYSWARDLEDVGRRHHGGGWRGDEAARPGRKRVADALVRLRRVFEGAGRGRWVLRVSNSEVSDASGDEIWTGEMRR